jgi:hypothetical protein
MSHYRTFPVHNKFFYFSLFLYKHIMTFCPNCGQKLTLETEKYCPNCSQNFDKIGDKDSINISGNHEDVFGVGFSGSNNVIGKNIVISSGTINVSKQELAKIDSEYADALKQFSESLNQQLKGKQIPEDKVQEVNNSLNELAKEVKDIKPGQKGEQEIDYEKQKNIEAKTGGLIQRILNVLPQAAETAATFTPLAPFSKLIGKGVDQIVDEISKRKKM